MSANNISVHGSLTIGGNVCVSACGDMGADRTVKSLSSRCMGATYGQIADVVINVNTGNPGLDFVDVLAASGFTSIEFLQIRTEAPVQVRLGATTPQVTSSLNAPSSSLNTQNLNLVFAKGNDSVVTLVAVNTVFDAGDLTMQDAADAINAAAVSAGLGYLPASLNGGGYLVLKGTGKGPKSSIVISGTAQARLGLGAVAGLAVGAGNTVLVNGLALLELVQPGTQGPVGLELSGIAKVQLVVAGR